MDGAIAEVLDDLWTLRLPFRHLLAALPIDPGAREMLEEASECPHLSGRAQHKALRIACALADLARDDGLRAVHMAEAIGLRCLDRPQQSVPAIG